MSRIFCYSVSPFAITNSSGGKNKASEIKRWEGLLVVPRLGCTEGHGLLEKMHCLPNTFSFMVKATGDLCLKKQVKT